MATVRWLEPAATAPRAHGVTDHGQLAYPDGMMATVRELCRHCTAAQRSCGRPEVAMATRT